MENGKANRDGPVFGEPLTPPPEYHGLALEGVFRGNEDREERLRHNARLEKFSETDGHDSQASTSRLHGEPVSLTPKLEHQTRVQRTLSASVVDPRYNGATVESQKQRRPMTGLDIQSASVNGVSSAGAERDVSSGQLSPALSSKDEETTFPPNSTSKPLSPLVEGVSLQLSSSSLNSADRKSSHDNHSANRPRISSANDASNTVLVHNASVGSRPRAPRALSTPASLKSPSLSSSQEGRKAREGHRSDQNRPSHSSAPRHALPSPIPSAMPIPPLSLSSYLQLELSSQRNGPAFIPRPSEEFPYESSRVKIERLLNFLFLPVQLEALLWFGVLACLDAWLYTFTILPLRMIKSIIILTQSFIDNLIREGKFILSFIYQGLQRVWSRRRSRAVSEPVMLSRTSSEPQIPPPLPSKGRPRASRVHKTSKAVPSKLMPDDKADILKGALIITTCMILLRFDASRMYHWVRGQAAIKLYVIYNLLEVCDRLLSALGQDVLECLFSRETLERKPDGHSKVLRPLWLFILALAYCVTHATALFYQVITLNVAVNSYSNALITLLMSNQFVEIKGTVFKKFEKENLFQLTCADVVERFQLWHMLMIIASRNIVETGVFTLGTLTAPQTLATATTTSSPNITQAAPLSATSILPRSFMLLPSMLNSVTSYVPTISHVLGPFVIVLGSEMFIDWLKHAYIGKFNNTRPIIYARFLDILTKDYYTNAFGEQNLTKRLGLPVLPLSCLMIRAGFQTYQMFVASWVPSSSDQQAATLASIHQAYQTTRAIPTSTAVRVVRTVDDLFSSLPAILSNPRISSYLTTTLVLLLMFLILLVCKLSLGMFLLAVSRSRYKSLKEREALVHHSPYIEGGRRVGGWGAVEVDEEKRRLIYEDDPGALQALRTKENKHKAKMEQEMERPALNDSSLSTIRRFELSAGAKRIW